MRFIIPLAAEISFLGMEVAAVYHKNSTQTNPASKYLGRPAEDLKLDVVSHGGQSFADEQEYGP